MSMQAALRGALRQDPDVIMIGEMRDFATIQTAITAAETGHLVVSTLHTNTAAQALDRIIDSFPTEAKNQLRLQLANSLLGVITQRLVRKADGNGRVVACEILTKSPSVEKAVLENRIADLDTIMESSNLYYKMQSMNQALEKLIRDGVITQEEGLLNSDKKEDLTLKLSGMTTQSQGADAADLLNQQKEATQFTQRPSILPAGKSAPLSDVEPSRLLDMNGHPDTSGLKLESGPEQVRRERRPGSPSKGFAALFKKKTG
jgi:Tfp pilus assembly ATPase PilU